MVFASCYSRGCKAIFSIDECFREHSDTGFAYTQHPSIRNGAPGDVPDLRTHTHIDSVNVTTGQQILMQAVRLVNRNLSSWTLRLEAFAKSPDEEGIFECGIPSCYTAMRPVLVSHRLQFEILLVTLGDGTCL
jgi:hypothetical protein